MTFSSTKYKVKSTKLSAEKVAQKLSRFAKYKETLKRAGSRTKEYGDRAREVVDAVITKNDSRVAGFASKQAVMTRSF